MKGSTYFGSSLGAEPAPATRVKPNAKSIAAGWTEAREAELRDLWIQGLSATQIARKMGSLTRNAVIGKVGRLGLAKRSSEANRIATKVNTHARNTPSAPRAAGKLSANPIYKGDPITSPLQKRLATEEANAAARLKTQADGPRRDEGPGLATVLTLGTHMCKWPIGDPALDDFTFCGKRKDLGPYCAEHAKRATTAPKPGRPKTGNEMMRSLRRVL